MLEELRTRATRVDFNVEFALLLKYVIHIILSTLYNGNCVVLTRILLQRVGNRRADFESNHYNIPRLACIAVPEEVSRFQTLRRQ